MTKTGSFEIEDAFASVKLGGTRFDQAQIPVESLIELLRYRELIIAAATNAWELDHPGESVPAALHESFELTLTDVADGSAIPLLERPIESDFDTFFEDGKDDVDQLLRDVNSGGYEPRAFPKWADIDAFWNFGETLQPEETMIVPAPVGTTKHFAQISQVTRTQYFYTLKKKVRASADRTQAFGAVTGRVTALDAENRNFDISTVAFGSIHGRFKTVDITDDLREFLGSSSDAPNIIILGLLGYKEGTLEKVHEATFAVQESDPFAATAQSLTTIAETESGWLEGGVQAVTLDASKLGSKVLNLIKAADVTPPRVFPTEDGGLSFEWATSSYVLSFEIDSNFRILAYKLGPDENFGTESVVENLEQLPDILGEWKEILCG